MQIARLEVEEGFLDGLVMDFASGLNVLIGSRGTGKTSVVELLRFCLDVKAFTAEAESSARKHAIQVLGTGRVVVTAIINGEPVSITRSVIDERPRLSRDCNISTVTVLSQTEIEQIGLDIAGQVRLLDDYAPQAAHIAREERAALERIRAASAELRSLGGDKDSLAQVIRELNGVRAELADAQLEESQLLGAMQEKKAEQDELRALSEQANALANRQALLDSALAALRDFGQRIGLVVTGLPRLPEWPPNEPDGLALARTAVEQISQLVQQASDLARSAAQQVSASESDNRLRQSNLSDRSRELRRVLDAVNKGVGAASARVNSLQERLGALEPTVARFRELSAQIKRVQEVRQDALDDLDLQRESRFLVRDRAAKSLNGMLGPKIDVRVIRYGRQERYAAAIAGALRGSRLHYNELAPALARALSPRELVEAAESQDVLRIADISGIDMDRASRLLEAIRAEGGGEILSAPLEDSVELLLLDGADYKMTPKLSTGQRCTVVLPILLEQRGRVLVIDQPEDHLDNGFITETVVKAVRSRAPEDQLIIATHNANIPVLGEAQRVFVMGSDGSNGFVDKTGPLEASEIVEAITRIMEGGWIAFERRREFYKSHGA